MVGGKSTGGTATSTVEDIGLYTSCIALNVYHNYTPTISAVKLNNNSNLNLTVNATTTFTINYTVQDLNGCTDIYHVTSTAFRTGASSTCETANPTTDNRWCYLGVVSSTGSCVSGTNYNETDTVALYYFADSTGSQSPTSSYPTQDWVAYAVAVDKEGATSSVTNSTSSNVDVVVLTGFNVSPASSTYGTLLVGQNTSSTNQIHYVSNAGNSSTTLAISGTAFR